MRRRLVQLAVMMLALGLPVVVPLQARGDQYCGADRCLLDDFFAHCVDLGARYWNAPEGLECTCADVGDEDAEWECG